MALSGGKEAIAKAPRTGCAWAWSTLSTEKRLWFQVTGKMVDSEDGEGIEWDGRVEPANGYLQATTGTPRGTGSPWRSDVRPEVWGGWEELTTPDEGPGMLQGEDKGVLNFWVFFLPLESNSKCECGVWHSSCDSDDPIPPPWSLPEGGHRGRARLCASSV